MMTTAANGVLPSAADTQRTVQLLAQHWPGQGGRHPAYQALTGGLLRSGLSVERTEALVKELAEATDDEEATKRIAAVQGTAARLEANEHVTGCPKLAEALGADGECVVRDFKCLLGLTITLEQLAAHKGLPVEYLQALGLHDLRSGGVGIPYRDGSGQIVEVKTRTALQAGRGSFWPKGKRLMAYGEDRLEAAVAAGCLIVVEGESDTWALWHDGFPALGLPGAKTVEKTLSLGQVAAVKKVYLIQEPDQGGEDFVAGVRRRLAALGWRSQLLVVKLDGAKDPSELHQQHPDRDEFKKRFQGALDRAELATIPATAAQPAAPRLAPYQPFPTEALPEVVRALVVQGATALGCDPAFLALPALALVASLIGNTRTIRLKRDWTEPCVIWAGVVADSGTLKSPASKLTMAPVFRLQRRLLDEYKVQRQAHEIMKAAYEQRRKAHQKGEGADPGPAPQEPVCVRLVCSDITIERLAELLGDNPHGLLLFRDELSGWISSFARYKGKNGGSDLPGWLEMYRAEALIVDRKTGERRTLFVPRAAVLVSGGFQPGVLARVFTTEFLEAGLLARVLLAMPARRAKRWSEEEVDPEVRRRYEERLEALRAIESDRGTDGEPVPVAVQLSPEARAIWVRFYDEWALEQAATEGELAACYSKIEAYARAAGPGAPRRQPRHRPDRQGAGRPREHPGRHHPGPLVRGPGSPHLHLPGRVRRGAGNPPPGRVHRGPRRPDHGQGASTVELLEISDRRARREGSEPAGQGRLGGLAGPTSDRQGGRPTRDCVLQTIPTTDETDPTSPKEMVGETSSPTIPPEPSDDTPAGPRDSQGLLRLVGNVGSRTQEMPSEEAPEGQTVPAGATGVSSDGALEEDMEVI